MIRFRKYSSPRLCRLASQARRLLSAFSFVAIHEAALRITVQVVVVCRKSFIIACLDPIRGLLHCIVVVGDEMLLVALRLSV